MIIKLPRNRIVYLSTLKTLIIILVMSVTCFVYFTAISYQFFAHSQKITLKTNPALSPVLTPSLKPTPIPTPIPQEIKKIIAKAPVKPKPSAIKTNPATTCPNGKQLITTAGTISCQEMPTAPPASISNPINIPFEDETGNYASLEAPLKEYLATLKWSSEISSISAIKIVDTGDVGWAGQYSFSYSQKPSGEISSVIGLIKLNTYYPKLYYSNDMPTFTKYLELVLSHEYGHHYTQYYKLTKWNLANNTRFPDSYYSTRPLPKDSTAYDYSLGWENCDAEIIAEDYSYIYSGFGYHGMSAKYGYPTSIFTTWFTTTLIQGPTAQPTPTPPPNDNPPTISIISPIDNTTVSSTITIQTNVSDDHAISKVSLYVNNKQISDDSSAPYDFSLFTGTYDNGQNTIKVTAYDSSNQTASSSTNLIFNNPKPDIIITSPTPDPYTWATGDLLVDVSATSELGITKIEIYINDQLAGQRSGNHIIGTLQGAAVPVGTYTLKAIAYDKSGNTAQKTITFTKQ